MPIVYGPESALVSLVWETTNTRSGGAATVLGFEGAQDSVAALTGVASLVEAAWDAHLKEETDNSWQLGVIRVESASFSIEESVDILGTNNFLGPPSNVTVLDSKAAAGKGPRNRGRNYWPALVAESEVDERGLIAPTRQTSLNDAFADFYAQIIGSGIDLAIPQSETENQKSEPITPWPIVVSRGVQAFVATQRRRVR